MNRWIKSTVSIGSRLAPLLALTTWFASQWQVFGVVFGPFSCAAGPGGWEICGWEVETWAAFSLFRYPVADEAIKAPAVATRLWGVFVYHWLVFGVLASLHGLQIWFSERQATH